LAVAVTLAFVVASASAINFFPSREEHRGALANTLEENARLFALLNIAMADAAICAWDANTRFTSDAR
jgi:hypothetical protein